ncbi:MAG: hypothetical protein DWQ07_24210 [Chloroflexi bacterium]|nr:MAG: hypothetical protein DWQ07_24210 [Chloroflexota bacterium]MBL1196238.1 hypothetical protein [Chloroflexota bacterium]NOH13532.1 hypothetical protein [Chloroflexota bacterium]
MTNTNEEINTFILKQLRKRQKANGITFEISQRYGLAWDEAAKTVHQVEKENHKELDKHQNRGTVLFSIGFMIIGVLLMLGTIYYTLTGHVLIISSIPYSGNLIALGTGIAFILGGFVGILTRNRK